MYGFNISRQCIAKAIQKIGFSRKRLRKRGFMKPDKTKERFETFSKLYDHDSKQGLIMIEKSLCMNWKFPASKFTIGSFQTTIHAPI